MENTNASTDLANALAKELPRLRRYARALTGSQEIGDRLSLAALGAIVDNPDAFDRTLPARVGLFRSFHRRWVSAGQQVDVGSAEMELMEARAHWRMRGLDPAAREALLLRSVERFEPEEIGIVMDVPTDRAKRLVAVAHDEMSRLVTGKVLIIEDEVVIAMDLQGMVEEMGHEVTGVAATCEAAIALGHQTAPDLILSDIQLADKSSGIDAVNALLGELGERPVIFVTAFPDRLLTGKRPEPAFFITKPYSEGEVRAAVSQAMFFATSRVITATAA